MGPISLRRSGKPRHSAIIFNESNDRRSLHGRSRSPRSGQPALNPFRFVWRVALRMRDIGLTRTASSLSFTTLLAIVPMATVALAFVARFPIFERWFGALEAFVFKNMLPSSTASVVHEYVLSFAEQAARLTGVSIALMAWRETPTRIPSSICDQLRSARRTRKRPLLRVVADDLGSFHDWADEALGDGWI